MCSRCFLWINLSLQLKRCFKAMHYVVLSYLKYFLFLLKLQKFEARKSFYYWQISINIKTASRKYFQQIDKYSTSSLKTISVIFPPSPVFVFRIKTSFCYIYMCHNISCIQRLTYSHQLFGNQYLCVRQMVAPTEPSCLTPPPALLCQFVSSPIVFSPIDKFSPEQLCNPWIE